jgi:hypothetical protein
VSHVQQGMLFALAGMLVGSVIVAVEAFRSSRP